MTRPITISAAPIYSSKNRKKRSAIFNPPDTTARKLSITSIISAWPIENQETFSVLRYDKGDFYKRHHDNTHDKKFKRKGGSRVFSAYIFLNEGYGGGEFFKVVFIIFIFLETTMAEYSALNSPVKSDSLF